MTILGDSVDYCVVKPLCSGPSSFVRVTAQGDRWECHTCNGYVITPTDVTPSRPHADAQSSR